MKFYEKVMIDEYLNEYKESKIEAYIKKIRNKNKKAYAKKYYEWVKSGEKGDSPDKGSLSVMGAQSVRMNIDDMMEESTVNEAPIKAKGWSQKSIEKFEKTIGKEADEKGFFDKCVARMEPKMGDKAKGFCASLKDSKHGSSHWRGKGKSKKEIKKDTEANQYSKSKRLPKYRKKKST